MRCICVYTRWMEKTCFFFVRSYSGHFEHQIKSTALANVLAYCELFVILAVQTITTTSHYSSCTKHTRSHARTNIVLTEISIHFLFFFVTTTLFLSHSIHKNHTINWTNNKKTCLSSSSNFLKKKQFFFSFFFKKKPNNNKINNNNNKNKNKK